MLYSPMRQNQSQRLFYLEEKSKHSLLCLDNQKVNKLITCNFLGISQVDECIYSQSDAPIILTLNINGIFFNYRLATKIGTNTLLSVIKDSLDLHASPFNFRMCQRGFNDECTSYGSKSSGYIPFST